MGNCPTPLRRAVRYNENDKVRSILDEAGPKAADVINNDHSPDCILGCCSKEQGNSFYYAVQRGRTEAVKMMLEKGADIHSTGLYDETCLHCAVRHNHVTIVRLLVEAGCDLYATDDHGDTPIHCTGMSFYDTSEVIQYLLQEVGKKDDVNAQNYGGFTALHKAAVWGNVAASKALLEHGADINAKSKSGATPLHSAKKPDIWRFLVSQGADMNAETNTGHKPVPPDGV